MSTRAIDTGAEAAEQFWRDGFCVLRSVVSADTLVAASAAVDALPSAELADLSALAGDSGGARFRAGVDHWRTHPAFEALATEGILPALAAAVLRSERVWLYEDSVLVKEPGSEVSTKWHTDDGYFHVEGRQLATMWVPLDPAPLSAGALRFMPGSHATERRYRPTLFVTDDPIPGTDGDAPPDHTIDHPSTVGYDLEVGDLTIHHARTLHAASGNATATTRRALSIRYCGDDAVVRPKPGAPTKPGFDAIEPGTPLRDVAAQLGLVEAVLR